MYTRIASCPIQVLILMIFRIFAKVSQGISKGSRTSFITIWFSGDGKLRDTLCDI